MNTININRDTLSKWARWLGAGTLVVSFINFMLIGRYDNNSLSHFLIFLGLNVVITVCALVINKYLKDPVAGRTMMAISLSMIPAQFAQLAAFLYNRVHGIPHGLPDIVKLELPKSWELSTLFILASVIIIPITYLGFRIFNRNNSQMLSSSYLLLNSLLIIPVRSHPTLAVIALLMLVILWKAKAYELSNGPLEWRASKAILFIPLGVFVIRALLYPLDHLLMAFFYMLLAMAIILSTPKLIQRPRFATNVQFLSFMPLVFVGANIGQYFHWNLNHIWTLNYILIYLVSFFLVQGAKGVRFISSILLACCLFAQIDHYPLIINMVLGLVIPIMGMLTSIHLKEKFPFLVHGIAFLIFTLWHLFSIHFLHEVQSWVIFSLIGLVLIFGSSALRFFHAPVLVWYQTKRQYFSSWS